ncbi:glycoside hydrolase family 43 protein [Paenibacillus xylanexedens]|uniref:glycoside hydrolase family 43 protein n=1 Tax=Paenibacillus xylanexedens TaxID=528191 RepID=UPI0011A2343F|nr:glycoside hydrolase family 43 protein [Paenibacillus xylanexedens]
MRFTNPVIPGFYPDPSICRAGEDYYLVTSSFHYFPAVPIFHSRDLVHWKQIGHCLDRDSQVDLSQVPSSLGIFAPTLRYINGYFYMITTNVKAKSGTFGENFFVRATHPSGPWSDPIRLDWPGIDPSLYCHTDGRVYITGTSDFLYEEVGIYQAEINLDSGKLLTPRRLVWKGTGGMSPEGPHLYGIHGQYYLMISEGGTEYGHMVTIARSQNPFGPFESNPDNPILSHRSMDSAIQATGHADLVQFHDGSWWAVCLGIRSVSRKHNLGRETFLAPVSWSKDGWPVIGSNGQIGIQMTGPSFNTDQLSQTPEYCDNFLDHKLDDTWNFLRNPYQTDWSLSERPGWVTLHGSPITLNDCASPAFIGRRQQHMECTVSSILEFEPVQEGEEAGMTVFMDERFHYEIALTLIEGRKTVFLRKRVGSLSVIEGQTEYQGTTIKLEIEADTQWYTFSFYDLHGETIRLGRGERGLLSSEVAGGFTGVYFGLYATGNGRSSTSPAYFNLFNYSIYNREV